MWALGLQQACPAYPQRRVHAWRSLPTPRLRRLRRAQTDFLSAATANALTTVLAGFAFTTHILPKISLLPAFVAGFTRVFTMATPGIVNLPAFFTSVAATLARLSRTDVTSFFFISSPSAMACARPPLLMTGPAFFIAFIGAMARMRGEYAAWTVASPPCLSH